MTIQPTSVPKSLLPLTEATVPDAQLARSPEQQAAKAQKKERKRERLRFFAAWCNGWQAFGSAF